jgi:VWFA-related protein
LSASSKRGLGEIQVKELLIGGALALMLAAPQAGQQIGTGSTQQVASALPDGPQQQAPPQAVPDAPRPHTEGLADVTPGKGTTVTSNGVAATPLPIDPDAPGTSLPGISTAEALKTNDGTAPDQPPAGQGAPYLITVRTNFVDVPFTVKDSKGKLVPGLTWRDVQVYENGARQHMSVFTVDPFPLSVALVIDQSLDFKTMERVNNALGALQGAFTPYDEVAVFTYNHHVKEETTFTSGQSPRLSAVIERSKSTGSDPVFYDAGSALGSGINLNNGAEHNITPLGAGQGHTLGNDPQVPREAHTLNDAILEAAKSLTRAGKDRRRVIYVISDGKEYGSVAKTKDVIKYLQTNKISVYATLAGDSSVEGLGFLNHVHLPLMVRDNILPLYSAATGGETYAEFRTRGIADSFQKIAEEVRTQYTVGYYSREPSVDGKFRQIEVRVLRPKLDVIAKKGYYPSAAALPPPAVRPSTPATP